jgi:hypothetical protein
MEGKTLTNHQLRGIGALRDNLSPELAPDPRHRRGGLG